MRDIMISEILGILIFPVISASDRLICLKDSCEFVQVGNQSARKSHCLLELGPFIGKTGRPWYLLQFMQFSIFDMELPWLDHNHFLLSAE